MLNRLYKFLTITGEIIPMQIFADADACPVVDIVERIAEKYKIAVTLLCDTNYWIIRREDQS